MRRARAIIAWTLAASAVIAFVGGTAGERLRAEETLERRARTFRFDGRVGSVRPSSLHRFEVPAEATIQTHLVWSKAGARLKQTLQHRGARIAATKTDRGTRWIARTYRSAVPGRYAIAVETIESRSRYSVTVRVTWMAVVTSPSPSSSPSPSKSVTPTASPTASPTPGPVDSPSPSPTGSPSPSTSPVPAGWPVKIFAVGTPATKVDAALANPQVSGISSRFTWASLEPTPGAYRWTAIDNMLAKAKGADKLAMIRVLAGIYTPDWVKGQVTTLTFSSADLYNPANYPAQVTMPVPWDPRYLSLWKRFVTALGARYNGDPAIHSIQMAGGGFIGEMTLPTDVQKWLRAGYTDAKYIGCWNEVTSTFRSAFPLTPIVLDITEPFGQVLTTNVVAPVVAFATDPEAKRAFIQSNALRASMLGTMGPYRRTIRASAAVTQVGYQMIGDAPTADNLRQAFQVAVEDRVNYVEVYGSDVLDPLNSGALLFLASQGTQ